MAIHKSIACCAIRTALGLIRILCLCKALEVVRSSSSNTRESEQVVGGIQSQLMYPYHVINCALLTLDQHHYVASAQYEAR